MGFFDTYKPVVDQHTAPKQEKPTMMNILAGECTECGTLSDNVMFGYCEQCAFAEADTYQRELQS